MTKTINKFAASLNAVVNARELNPANVKKMQSCALLATRADVVALLDAANVDEKRFDARAIYATEKCVKLVAAVAKDTVSLADFEKNVFATFKTVINAFDAEENLRKSDIEQCILSDAKVAKEREHIVYARKVKISATAQVQQCLDMLRTLNVTREVATNAYAINAENAILQRVRAQIADLAF